MARAAAAPRTAYPRSAEVLAPRPHRGRRAGEAVAQQHADRAGRRSAPAGRRRDSGAVGAAHRHGARFVHHERRQRSAVRGLVLGQARLAAARQSVGSAKEVAGCSTGSSSGWPSDRCSGSSSARRSRAPRTSPTTGPAILASNHLSYADWLFMPLTLPRRVTFVAKAEYFTTPGHQGLVPEEVLLRRRPGADRPVRRHRGRGRAHGREADPRRGRPVRHLPRGHPLPRRQALPRQDRRRPARARDQGAGDPGRRGRHRRGGAARARSSARSPGPVVRFGKPLDFSRYEGMENDRYILRSITDEIMYEIMRLSGQEYVDMYATRAKEESKKAGRSGRRGRGRGRGRADADRRRRSLTVPAPVRRAATWWFGRPLDGRGPAVPWLAVLRLRAAASTRSCSTSTAATTSTTPSAGVACVVVMVGVDGVRDLGVRRPAAPRRPLLLVADLAVARRRDPGSRPLRQGRRTVSATVPASG